VLGMVLFSGSGSLSEPFRRLRKKKQLILVN